MSNALFNKIIKLFPFCYQHVMKFLDRFAIVHVSVSYLLTCFLNG